MTIRDTLRRWRNPEWRYAHRGDRMTLLEWALIVLVMLLMSGVGYGYDTIRLREEAREHIDTTGRVLGCLNGQTSLGEHVEADGTRWAIMCAVFERRISGHQS